MSEKEELYNIIGAMIMINFPTESANLINSLRKLETEISISMNRAGLPTGSTELTEIIANIFAQLSNNAINIYPDLKEVE